MGHSHCVPLETPFSGPMGFVLLFPLDQCLPKVQRPFNSFKHPSPPSQRFFFILERRTGLVPHEFFLSFDFPKEYASSAFDLQISFFLPTYFFLPVHLPRDRFSFPSYATVPVTFPFGGQCFGAFPLSNKTGSPLLASTFFPKLTQCLPLLATPPWPLTPSPFRPTSRSPSLSLDIDISLWPRFFPRTFPPLNSFEDFTH